MPSYTAPREYNDHKADHECYPHKWFGTTVKFYHNCSSVKMKPVKN